MGCDSQFDRPEPVYGVDYGQEHKRQAMKRKPSDKIEKALARRLGLKFNDTGKPYRPAECPRNPTEGPLFIDEIVWDLLVKSQRSLKRLSAKEANMRGWMERRSSRVKQ